MAQVAHEAYGVAPDIDEGPPDGHLEVCIDGGGRFRRCGPPRDRRVRERLVDQPQLIRLSSAKGGLDLLRRQLSHQLSQPPCSGQIQRSDAVRDDHDLADAGEIQRRERGVDLGHLQGPPFTGELQLETALPAMHVEEGAQACAALPRRPAAPCAPASAPYRQPPRCAQPSAPPVEASALRRQMRLEEPEALVGLAGNLGEHVGGVRIAEARRLIDPRAHLRAEIGQCCR